MSNSAILSKAKALSVFLIAQVLDPVAAQNNFPEKLMVATSVCNDFYL